MISLFTVPIYSCNLETFKKSYERFIRSKMSLKIQAAKSTNILSEEEVVNEGKSHYWKEGIWEYNQIVGFIKVYFNESSIWLDLYLPEDFKSYIFTTKKKYLSLHVLNGAHFCLEDNNVANRIQMKKYMEMVIESLPKKYFVNLKEFEFLNSAIDYLLLK